MSEPKPFAEFSGNCMSIPEADYEVYPSMPRSAAAINAAVTARERKAAAKALRAFADSEALKDDFGHGEVITKHDVRTALRAEADSVEKGEP